MIGASATTLACALGSAITTTVATISAFSGAPTETQTYVGGAIEQLTSPAAPALAFAALLSIILIIDGIESTSAVRLISSIATALFSAGGSTAFFVHANQAGQILSVLALIFSLANMGGVLKAGPMTPLSQP